MKAKVGPLFVTHEDFMRYFASTRGLTEGGNMASIDSRSGDREWRDDGTKEPGFPPPNEGIGRAQAVHRPERDDPWAHRSSGMRCRTCMWFVEKELPPHLIGHGIGRCRRHGPTMNGYPVVFKTDWCGDHKLDELRGDGD